MNYKQMDELPNDILVSILSYLPAHTIINCCGGVSVRWHQLIHYGAIEPNGQQKDNVGEGYHFHSDWLWEDIFMARWMKNQLPTTATTTAPSATTTQLVESEQVTRDLCWKEKFEVQLAHLYTCRVCHERRSLNDRIREHTVVHPCECPGFVDQSCLDQSERSGFGIFRMPYKYCSACKSFYCLERSKDTIVHPALSSMVQLSVELSLFFALYVFVCWMSWWLLGKPLLLVNAPSESSYLDKLTMYSHAASIMGFFLFCVIVILLDVAIVLSGNVTTNSFSDLLFNWQDSDQDLFTVAPGDHYSFVGYTMMIVAVFTVLSIITYRNTVTYNRRMTRYYQAKDSQHNLIS